MQYLLLESIVRHRPGLFCLVRFVYWLGAFVERIHNDAKQNFKSNRVGFSQKVFGSVYCQKTKDFCQAGNFTFFKVFVLYSLIAIRHNYNSDMLATIWHEIVCWFLKIYQDLKRFAAQEHRIVFLLISVFLPVFDYSSMLGTWIVCSS